MVQVEVLRYVASVGSVVQQWALGRRLAADLRLAAFGHASDPGQQSSIIPVLPLLQSLGRLIAKSNRNVVPIVAVYESFVVEWIG